ncbi:MAG: restriction endonuclease [Gammaproteobacteria bacterium]|nr:MAG: restriction endonuclease [Gammaproteobacteria bacterium]
MIKIEKHLSQHNLDIRKSGDARFMDQKVTPDVLCVVADCVLQFSKDGNKKEFSTKNIWESEYANENIKDIFNKPDVLDKKASSEYDKFFAQPLRMLAYSKILKLRKKGGKNIFTINNKELLEFISVKERNALTFIVLYLEKILKDSGILHLFETFFKDNTKNNFNNLKGEYETFIIKWTPINGKTEVRRIFTKIINPLSYNRKSHGTKGGFFSQDVIGYDELMYNRKNWRDVTKIKGETRQEYENRAKQIIEARKNAFVRFTMEKAKRLIRARHVDISEVKDKLAVGQATQIHHIFSKSDYPEIKSYLENLILLTATQHSTKAHPNNNTRLIDKDYQLLCLLSKMISIKKSVKELDDGFYSKDDLILVLNAGIKPQEKFIANKTFDDIEQKITYEYHRN